jgi:hypothetical protein
MNGNNISYWHKPTVAGPDRTDKKCSSLTSHGFVSPEVMAEKPVLSNEPDITDEAIYSL